MPLFTHRMRLSCAIVVCNDNFKYLEFWPIVKQAWWDIVGIPCVMVYVADTIFEFLKIDPAVIHFRPIPELSVERQLQIIGYLYPALFKGDGDIVLSSIDMIPVEKDISTGLKMVQILSSRGVNEEKQRTPTCCIACPSELLSNIYHIKTQEDIYNFLGNMNSTSDKKIHITNLSAGTNMNILKDYYKTSINIRLTTPETTKEVLQIIKYCKGLPFDNNLTKYCFKAGIDSDNEIPCKTELQKEFEDTDLFIVEISNRTVYTWNTHVVHKSLYAKMPLNVETYNLTNEEIEADILQIKQLIYPKKLLISQFLEDKSDLTSYVEEVCMRHDIPFVKRPDIRIIPINMNDTLDTDYDYKEYILFNQIYKNKIDSIFNVKTAVLVWKSSFYNYPQTNRDNFWGIGDMIRGVIGMYKLSKKYKFDLIVDKSLHPLSMLLKCDRHRYTNLIEENQDKIPLCMPHEVEHILQNELINNSENDTVCFYTNMQLDAYNGGIPSELQEFIDYILRPSSAFEVYTAKLMNTLAIDSYTIIHYRLGDDEMVRNQCNYSIYENAFTHLLKTYKETDIVITDSAQFKDLIRKKNTQIRVLDTKICHVGIEHSYEALRDTLFEFNLLRGAKSIRSYSRYDWISGFVYAIHKIYNIPLEGHCDMKF